VIPQFSKEKVVSYKSLNTQVNDLALQARVEACMQQEARVNPNVNGGQVAESIRNGIFGRTGTMMWDVSIDTEEAYEYALNVPVENPGADETVITDAMLLSAVQAHWPAEPSV
jgi:hypothetical protein